ncbi:DAK2 domain-containing protein [Flavivirga spongiicola]|uniref:Dihydroxyacetone kinase subunit L n=1 Tax=Flavivirga spongiicola TaxID=421621 RepID=A0ABU7Y1X0_9FLAO|nr:DAK2 domain-containing protein [Flavivirga sp. MEBiC05379]MDO5981124.1 DAK2 domain-containing protein [Flavivirga sp. MEBiC05379]
MEKLTIDAFKSMMRFALTNITERAEELSNLDAVAGDGDHGTAIVAALNAVMKAGESGVEFNEMLGNMAFGTMEESCGSTSTLMGAFFMGMADASKGDALDVKEVKNMFRSGLNMLQTQTKAKIGDKTMMDALVPAVEAIESAEGDIVEILNKGAKAALVGAEKTIAMKANFGRARHLGERSIGTADPGATSWACMFESFSKAIEQYV